MQDLKIMRYSMIFIIFLGQSAFAAISSTQSKEYIIKFKNNISDKSLSKLSIPSVVQAKEINTSFGRFKKINLSTNKISKQTLELIRRSPQVEFIEPNYKIDIVDKNMQDSDKGIDEQHERGHRDRFADQWGLKQAKVDKAWQLSRGDRDIIVAIIDSGINFKHPDLKENLWINAQEQNGTAGVDDDGNGYIDDVYGYDFAYGDGTPYDGNGHGSHCAGVIGASHNQIGIKGVNANIKLMGVQFGYSTGSGNVEKAIMAIDYALKMKADIISSSWGGHPHSKALKAAIEMANKMGVVFVAAAGNKKRNIDQEPFYPASYDIENVISVGAIDRQGLRASFSNYGKSVDIFAPGEKILSTVSIKNTNPYWYRYKNGTSMATPLVAGAIALLIAREGKLSPQEIKRRLIQSASGRNLDVEALLKN